MVSVRLDVPLSACMRCALVLVLALGLTTVAPAQFDRAQYDRTPQFDPHAQSGAVPGPAAEPQVLEVRVVGNKSVQTSQIMPHIRTRPNRPLAVNIVEDDVRRLNQTRMFLAVEPLYQKHPSGGVIVIFQVFERPTLSGVHFVGNDKLSYRSLKKQVELEEGGRVDPYAVEDGRRKLEEYYHTKGFSKARVSILEGTKPGETRVVYLINEGVKQKVRWVSFEGNTIASDSRLKTRIQSKPGILWLFKGEVDLKKIDDDVDRLTAYYRSLGYFSARVGRELNFDDAGEWLDLKFVIDEGPRYNVRNVSFAGNSKFATDTLMEQLKLNGGEPFDQGDLNEDLSLLRDLYGSQGYVFADVQADPRFLEEPGQLDLVYNIDEGKRYRVGRIDVKIEGEYPHTRIKTVLNRISLQPGDICDIRELRNSERRLRASGLFISNPAQGMPPKITFTPPDPGTSERGALARQGTPGVRGQSPDPKPAFYRPPPAHDASHTSYRIAADSRADDEVVDLQIGGTWEEPTVQAVPRVIRSAVNPAPQASLPVNNATPFTPPTAISHQTIFPVYDIPANGTPSVTERDVPAR